MRIQKNLIFVSGIVSSVAIYAVSGYFGFDMDVGIVTTAIGALAALANPSETSKEE
jgi:hypothetical protein